MDGNENGEAYRLVVRPAHDGWRWTLLRGETIAMTGEAPGLEDAVRWADFDAGAHAAFERIGRRRV